MARIRRDPRAIPACAGNSQAPQVQAPQVQAGHPRVCGEQAPAIVDTSPENTGHPRVCGEQVFSPTGAGCPARAIPACAGNRRPPRQHPRLVGGPSPRVRGTGCGGRRPGGRQRAIPACAGNRQKNTQMNVASTRAIPACAGNSADSVTAPDGTHGPSPRVRGTGSSSVAY